MTRYELKDKNKQAKFLAVFPDFLTALTNAMNHLEPGAQWVPVQSGEYEYSVTINPEDVETFAEYDPHAWNNYPKVTPPEGVWMRVEVLTLAGIPIRKAMFYKSGRWGQYPLDPGEVVNSRLRFRPWDEEEAAK